MSAESQEAVALELLKIIAAIEDKCIDERDRQKPDREWILTTYAQCLALTRSRTV